jgi:hypothetical protein
LPEDDVGNECPEKQAATHREYLEASFLDGSGTRPQYVDTNKGDDRGNGKGREMPLRISPKVDVLVAGNEVGDVAGE